MVVHLRSFPYVLQSYTLSWRSVLPGRLPWVPPVGGQKQNKTKTDVEDEWDEGSLKGHHWGQNRPLGGEGLRPEHQSTSTGRGPGRVVNGPVPQIKVYLCLRVVSVILPHSENSVSNCSKDPLNLHSVPVSTSTTFVEPCTYFLPF